MLAYLGSYGLFGWVQRGMGHRGLTTDGCRGADPVRARCTNSLEPAVGEVGPPMAAAAQLTDGCA